MGYGWAVAMVGLGWAGLGWALLIFGAGEDGDPSEKLSFFGVCDCNLDGCAVVLCCAKLRCYCPLLTVLGVRRKSGPIAQGAPTYA